MELENTPPARRWNYTSPLPKKRASLSTRATSTKSSGAGGRRNALEETPSSSRGPSNLLTPQTALPNLAAVGSLSRDPLYYYPKVAASGPLRGDPLTPVADRNNYPSCPCSSPVRQRALSYDEKPKGVLIELPVTRRRSIGKPEEALVKRIKPNSPMTDVAKDTTLDRPSFRRVTLERLKNFAQEYGIELDPKWKKIEVARVIYDWQRAQIFPWQTNTMRREPIRSTATFLDKTPNASQLLLSRDEWARACESKGIPSRNVAPTRQKSVMGIQGGLFSTDQLICNYFAGIQQPQDDGDE